MTLSFKQAVTELQRLKALNDGKEYCITIFLQKESTVLKLWYRNSSDEQEMTIKKQRMDKISNQITIDWIANNNGTDFFQKVGLCERLFYDRNKEEIWQIINNHGGLINFLKNDNDEQYIEDHRSLKGVLSWLCVEKVAQNMRSNYEII